MTTYFWLLVIGMAACVLFGLGLFWRERHLERRKIERYTLGPARDARALVCGKCLCRSYSKAAIERRTCPRCGSTEVRVG